MQRLNLNPIMPIEIRCLCDVISNSRFGQLQLNLRGVGFFTQITDGRLEINVCQLPLESFTTILSCAYKINLNTQLKCSSLYEPHCTFPSPHRFSNGEGADGKKLIEFFISFWFLMR
jgi:hypothetical protein